MTMNNTTSADELISRRDELMDILCYEPWNDACIQEFAEVVATLEKDFGYKDEKDDAFMHHIYTF